MKKLLEILGDCLIIAFGIVLLWQFSTIAVLGWYGYEPNESILLGELLASAGIVAFGVWRFVDDL